MNRRVCVVVPVFNRLQSTRRFIESFKENTYKNYTIIIFDDGSSDGTSEYLAKNHPEIVLLKGDGNYWWSGSTNEGVKYALDNNFDYVLTINNDAKVDKDLLKNLVSCAEAHPNSIVGARVMLDDSDKIYLLGMLVDVSALHFLHSHQYGADESVVEQFENPLPVNALCGDGALIPAEVFKKIGLYDSKWYPQSYGDVEFTYRATLTGYQCLVALDAIVYNYESVANTQYRLKDELFSKKSWRYWRPWVKFYLSYVPWRYKIFLLARFLLYITKRIIKTILRKSN